MLIATDGLDRLFSTNFPPIRLARDLGIAAVHRLPRSETRVHAPGNGVDVY